MRIEIGAGVLNVNDTAWGTTAEGLPVLLIRAPQCCVRIVFESSEAKDFGCAAIYLSMAAAPAAAKRPGLLVSADGGPLQ